MKQTSKFLGAVLLISGTTIGAGMLALPTITGFGGFFPALFQLFFVWIFMLATAFLYLEANIAYKDETNLISMADRTLGKWGKVVTWIAYLLLMYSLNAAYIAGSAGFFSSFFFSIFKTQMPAWAAPLPLLIFFSIFIYLGSKSADYLNRFLMAGLVITYLILAFFVPNNIDLNLIYHFDFKASFIAVPVIVTSFGYHIIIPTLTTYLDHDKKKLQYAIIVGSIIPLIFYLVWEMITLGIIPLSGADSLTTSYIKGEGGAGPLVVTLTNVLNKPWIAKAATSLTFFTIITSFMGVSLSLTDFLRDGLKIKKSHSGRFIACILTFLPPLIFVYANPRGFMLALQYAAIFVVIILCIMPALMTWTLPKPCKFNSFWGRTLIIAVLVISTYIIAMDIAEEAGLLQKLIAKYVK
ncbi:MAG: Tyrosine-specific transport protein [Candidatus Anoxychlamydiales bacterium]|nr:Tyrosine-specific transport protein [Candidatus Anoxychlamydiales bacterium]